ncbi:MAG: secretin and TonB N-terminal domain-containing protein, partial [Candidatus Aureabacteria bacterium]|nr:secretin and TonB N-terminal domain-containing protein [Candidatus Auribacterota bacterium]
MNRLKRISISLGLILAVLAGPVCAQGKTVSIDVENADIVAVLKMVVAQQDDLNIVISDNVVGNVTVQLDNVTLEQALDAILKMNNYTYEMDDNIIHIMSYQDVQHEERFAKKQTKVFSLQNADVLDIRRIILSMKTTRGRIELNARNNQIIVTDTPGKIEEIEKAIKELDQPVEIHRYNILYADIEDIQSKLLQIIPRERGHVFVDKKNNAIVVKATPIILKDVDELIKGWDFQPRQVLIESKMVKITLNDETKLGVEWEFKTGGKEGNKFADIVTKLTTSAATGGFFTLGSLTAGEYSATIEALKENKFAEVLSAPRVVVLDGKEARILVGSSEPYVVATTDPISHLVIEEIKYIDVGIKLLVTPRIGEDNFITMKVHPEVSRGEYVLNDQAVRVILTEADTTMMVKDGETAILGGLIDTEKSKEIDKVPLLGDIPLLGLLFRKNIDVEKKTELIIFITPRILSDEKRVSISKDEWDTFNERT